MQFGMSTLRGRSGLPFQVIASGRLGERWHRSDPLVLVTENDGEKSFAVSLDLWCGISFCV